MPAERPNVLLLMADQLRHDALGCAGSSTARTPNLDRLAAEGTRFSQAVTPTPICMAARYSLLTGRRARETGVTANGGPGGPDAPTPLWPTLMTCLNDAAYTTRGVGKFHFGRRPFGFQHQELMEECIDCLAHDDYLKHLQRSGVPTRFPQGLRDLLYYQPQTSGVPEPRSQNRWVADCSNAFLEEHAAYDGGRPFFLWSSWIAPHPPFAPVEPWDDVFDPDDMPPPVYADRPLESLPAPARAHRGRLDGAHLDPPRMRRIAALYHGQVAHVDACVGSVLDRLDALGLSKNTLVLFLSDHGEMLGDHGLSQKNTPYEASVRIPLIARWPGRIPAGAVDDRLACLTDVLPTVLDAADPPFPTELPPLPGASLLAPAPEREAHVIDFGHDDQRWVCRRSDKEKYVFWASGGREEAYDLAADPHELENLAERDDPPAWVARWRAAALAWEREHGLGDRSTDATGFRVWPEPPLDDAARAAAAGRVEINDGRWADRLPPGHPHPVESAAEAFDRAIAKETTLDPTKLSVDAYFAAGGSLAGTAWNR
ncbi:sulfatase family protein [Phycisphaera mikurensis]|uniref:Sulfatase n=1 Tax=Phycisphaera mikurensis (strain NBRC 102666 / KCTC 22515 / FYK2301M01) TaxID=1142394 RepID=I0IDH3_PHYMF|nr:sulfatase-like hydrolase/transferase [Phycisphaera mikurensis]MBB6441132.1 arylsulfatase A-like enzyme [Phycisphaera mikurensis]BAM03311.1 sulfatase [Phycisphaera mikurensis NBRC 102666]